MKDFELDAGLSGLSTCTSEQGLERHEAHMQRVFERRFCHELGCMLSMGCTLTLHADFAVVAAVLRHD